MIALRSARSWSRPPHQFWGLDGDEWWPEDSLLAQALEVTELRRCTCGCGGLRDECRDEGLVDNWMGRIGVHYRGQVLEQFRRENKEALEEPGAFAYLVDLREE